MRPWIFSPTTDLTAFAGPLILAAALSPILISLPLDPPPLWTTLLLVVSLDVAHVWATLYRTLLDPLELQRRRRLYLIAAPATAIAAFSLALHSETAFWTAAAYLAIYHFIKQDYGFLALYRHRAQAHSQRRLDQASIAAAALGPILLWHASPERHMDWFDAGETFLFGGLPSSTQQPILIIWLASLTILAILHARHALRAPTSQIPRLLFLALTTLRWSLGASLQHPLIALAFINLFHGLPYVILIHHVTRNAALEEDDPRPPLQRLGQRLALASPALFFAPLLLIALAEEGLWDALIWRRYTPAPLQAPTLSPTLRALAIAALAWPQLFHYLADAWLWRLDGSNPKLRERLFSSPRNPRIRELDNSARAC